MASTDHLSRLALNKSELIFIPGYAGRFGVYVGISWIKVGTKGSHRKRSTNSRIPPGVIFSLHVLCKELYWTKAVSSALKIRCLTMLSKMRTNGLIRVRVHLGWAFEFARLVLRKPKTPNLKLRPFRAEAFRGLVLEGIPPHLGCNMAPFRNGTKQFLGFCS